MLAFAIAAGALAYGCGTGGASAVIDPVADAAQTTTGAAGARMAMHMQVSISGLPQVISMDAGGHMSFKGQEGELSMQMNGLPGAAAGAFGEGGTIEERFVGGKVFMRAPGLAEKLQPGTSWVDVDIGAAAKKLGLDPQALSRGQSNPAQFLEYLRASGGSVMVTGSQRVRGVETTRYSGTIDLRKVPGADSGAAKEGVDKIVSMMGTSTIPVQAWVDGKKLIRRFSLTMPISVAGEHVETEITVEFFDFGPQHPVQAPPASATYELPAGAATGLDSAPGSGA